MGYTCAIWATPLAPLLGKFGRKQAGSNKGAVSLKAAIWQPVPTAKQATGPDGRRENQRHAADYSPARRILGR